MSASEKPRHQRLRQSCDGCFTAKVKCSKTQPICNRCLTGGIDCHYSPSSRIGKPKSTGGPKDESSSAGNRSQPAPVPDGRPLFYQAPDSTTYVSYDGGVSWDSHPTDMDDAISRSQSTAPGLGFNGAIAGPPGGAGPSMNVGGMYPAVAGWTSPMAPPAAQFGDSLAALAGQLQQGDGRPPQNHAFDPQLWRVWSEMARSGEFAQDSDQFLTPDSMDYYPGTPTTPDSQPPQVPQSMQRRQTMPGQRPSSSVMASPGGSGAAGASCTCHTCPVHNPFMVNDPNFRPQNGAMLAQSQPPSRNNRTYHRSAF